VPGEHRWQAAVFVPPSREAAGKQPRRARSRRKAGLPQGHHARPTLPQTAEEKGEKIPILRSWICPPDDAPPKVGGLPAGLGKGGGQEKSLWNAKKE